MSHRVAIAAVMLLALSACGGGGGHMASVLTGGAAPTGATGGGTTLSVTLSVPSTGLPTLTSAARASAASVYRTVQGRRRVLNVSLASYCASAILYEGAAGAAPQAGVQTSPYNASSIPSTFAFTFSNVPNGYNQWVIASVYGYSGQNCSGSSYLLGQLGGLVSVGSPPAFSTLDGGSTLRLQLALAAMYNGIISTYDVQNTIGLDNDLGNFIGSTGLQPDPATGLYDLPTLTTLLTDLYPIFNRTLTVNGTDSTVSVVALVFDYRQTYEQDFVANVDETIGTFTSSVIPAPGTSYGYAYPVAGNPFAESSAVYDVNSALGGSPQVSLQDVSAVEYPAPNGSITFQHVYGGALLIGMSARQSVTSAPPPFYGGFVAVAPRAEGIVTTTSIANASNTTLTMYMTDPQDAAFNDFGGVSVFPSADYFGIDCTLVSDDWCPNAAGILPNVSASVSPGPVTVQIDQYNPFALLSQSLELCAGLDCFPISSGSTVQVRQPFYDNGSDLSYFGWHPWSNPGNTVQNVTATNFTSTYPVYSVNYSGGTSGWIQTNTPAYMYPSQPVYIATNAPQDTTWFVRCDISGTPYSNSVVQAENPGYSLTFVDVLMTTVPSVAQCGDLEIGFTLPPGSSTSGSFYVVFPSWWDIATGKACVDSAARRSGASVPMPAASSRRLPSSLGKPIRANLEPALQGTSGGAAGAACA